MIKHLPLILTAATLLAALAGQWYVTGYRLDAAESGIADLATAIAAEAVERHEVYCYANRLHDIDPPPPGCP